MPISDRELAKWLRDNPDLAVARRTPLFPDEVRRIRPRMSEHEMQAEVVRRCLQRSQQAPEWALIFAIPNGAHRSGQRFEAGTRGGVPDIFWPIARGGYHGFFCELKVGKNKPTVKQQRWIDALRRQDYYVTVIWDNPEVVLAEMEKYLALGREG